MLVGVSNVAVSFVVFYACLTVWHATVATVIGYCAGVINSFLLNSAWTFKVDRSTDQFVRFVILNSLGAALSGALMYWAVDHLIWDPVVAWMVITAIVVVLNFVGCKKWVFAHA